MPGITPITHNGSPLHPYAQTHPQIPILGGAPAQCSAQKLFKNRTIHNTKMAKGMAKVGAEVELDEAEEQEEEADRGFALS